MGIQFHICAIALAAVATAAPANIYSNRGSDTRLPALNPTLLTKNGTSAPVGAYWSEVENNNPMEANNLGGVGCRSVGTTTGEFRLADDFEVVNGKMVISALKAYGYRSGTTTSTALFEDGNVNFLTDAPNGSPNILASGSEFSQSFAIPVSSSGPDVAYADIYRCFNTVAPAPGMATTLTRKIQECRIGLSSPLMVGPGAYWVDFQMNHPMPLSTPFGFSPHTTHSNTRTPPGLPGNALQLVATGWTASIDPGNPAAAPDIQQDFPFLLEGHVIRFTEDFVIVKGTPFGGVNADLQESDDVSVFVLLDENTPNGETSFPFQATISHITTFEFQVESGSDRDDQSYFVEITNADGSGYTQIGVGITTLDDVSNTYVVENAQSFVHPNGAIYVRIRTFPQNDLETADGWANRYDQVNLHCIP